VDALIEYLDAPWDTKKAATKVCQTLASAIDIS